MERDGESDSYGLRLDARKELACLAARTVRTCIISGLWSI